MQEKIDINLGLRMGTCGPRTMSGTEEGFLPEHLHGFYLSGLCVFGCFLLELVECRVVVTGDRRVSFLSFCDGRGRLICLSLDIL